ncbi:hypothetical protein TNCV_4711031 [Trichonephila clavipes]|uniref:Uncharacterized protein n=1 Tax=Trichonephila clavipes TaxID=2585209 RepID=A0A8X6RU70_TRICX|nr:hypothetical protein TNCV_4711031 [Trichonephila clavipes]
MERIDHPSCSPDLVPSDFSLFPKLKNWLKGQIFQPKQQFQNNVQAGLSHLTSAIYFEEDHLLTVHMSADELQIDHEFVQQIIAQNLGMKKRVIDIDDIPNIQRGFGTPSQTKAYKISSGHA